MLNFKDDRKATQEKTQERQIEQIKKNFQEHGHDQEEINRGGIW